ncbi:MAG: SpoVA/SpoVAEb family sporulation membrane protein [Ruminococcaceae bacterium]|nr:SpoVA/SpoVAEb family sporulation membrane protein [Oscillospiraceae bacterium]
MNMDKKSYARYVEARAPRSPLLADCLRAFLVGGGICLLAEGMIQLLMHLAGMAREDSATLTSVALVLIAVVLTGIGVFDRIAQFAGGGTLVPITGFANAVASSAIDSRAEGFVLGVGAKIFTVAGPVLLYGTASGALYGVIYFICKLAFGA